MRKIVGALAAISMLLTFSTMNDANEAVKIIVGNQPIQTHLTPIIEQGRLLVPIRVVTEALGATVDWDETTKTATISKWFEKIHLTVGQKTAMVEGGGETLARIPLDVSILHKNDRVFVPLRFLSQIYGYQVEWENNTVTIRSPLGADQQDVLYEGDLAEARKLAMALSNTLVKYAHDPLPTLHATEDFSVKYLFPEGEALRFYKINGNETVSFIEFKEDFPVVTWQAHIKNLGEDSIQSLFNDNLTDHTGPLPNINKQFLYYGSGIFGDSSWKESGLVDLDAKFTQSGYTGTVGGSVLRETGTVAYTLPNETREDVIERVSIGDEPGDLKNQVVLKQFQMDINQDGMMDQVRIIASHYDMNPAYFSAPVYLDYRTNQEQPFQRLALDVPPIDLTIENLKVRIGDLDGDHIDEIGYSIDYPQPEHVERWPHILKVQDNKFVDIDIAKTYHLLVADWDITTSTDGAAQFVLYEKNGVFDNNPAIRHYRLEKNGELVPTE